MWLLERDRFPAKTHTEMIDPPNTLCFRKPFSTFFLEMTRSEDLLKIPPKL